MDTSLFLPAVTTAVTIGLGCGACCGPLVSAFLSTYVVSHAGSAKNGAKSFAAFFLGKLVSVTILCALASILGAQFIGADGYVGGFNLRVFAQFVMSAIGAVMAVRWALKRIQARACGHCHDCGERKLASGFLPMLAAGFTYGFTPCAPLIMVLGLAFTLPVAASALTGLGFAVASAVSPVLVLSLVSGALSKRLMRELPRALPWFRLASYLVLAVMPFLVQIN